jgi:hypothetical protein
VQQPAFSTVASLNLKSKLKRTRPEEDDARRPIAGIMVNNEELYQCQEAASIDIAMRRIAEDIHDGVQCLLFV